MSKIKETTWMCENAKALERYSGQWVMFSIKEGVVSNGESLREVLKAGKHAHHKPYVFHVPSPEELAPPLPMPLKKQIC